MKPIFTVKELKEVVSKMKDTDTVVLEIDSELYPFGIKRYANVQTSTKIVSEIRLVRLEQKQFLKYK